MIVVSSNHCLFLALLAFFLLGHVTAQSSGPACTGGQDCSYTNQFADCSQGGECNFTCTDGSGCDGLIKCGSGPCNIVCTGYGPCWKTTVIGGSGPVTMQCEGVVGCQYLGVVVGTGPVDLECTGGGTCQQAIVTGGAGDLTINCDSPSSTQTCYQMAVTTGSGPSNIICNSIYVCNQATFSLASGPTSFYCYQGNDCIGATINGGTGTLNFTCDANTLCTLPTVIQNHAILTESATGGAFSCQPGQWQCPSDSANSNACVTKTCGCVGPDQCALIAFYSGLTSTGSLNWDTITDLCTNGAYGISCSGEWVTSL